jgi:hypothetical protein
MRSIGHWTEESTTGTTGQRGRRAYKVGLLFLVLLGTYLIMNWLPVDRGGEPASVDARFVLFWIAGGALTLTFLLVAGRKPSRKA